MSSLKQTSLKDEAFSIACSSQKGAPFNILSCAVFVYDAIDFKGHTDFKTAPLLNGHSVPLGLSNIEKWISRVGDRNTAPLPSDASGNYLA